MSFDGGYSINNPEVPYNKFSQKLIRYPSNFMLVADGGEITSTFSVGKGMPNPIPMDNIDHNGLVLRHNDGVNVLFADSHTKWLNREALRNADTWTLRGHPTPER